MRKKNMLTIIYVYEPATLTIEAQDARDEGATLRRYDKQLPHRTIRDLASAPLERGVYAVLSRGTMRMNCRSGRIETATLTKDDWPGVQALPEGATEEQVRAFFSELVKGGDV